MFSPVLFAQDNFPLNGVKETDQVYQAFINVDIMVNYKDKMKNGTLLIKGSEIIDVGTKVKIPKGTIIYDLNGLTICPSFIEIYSTHFQDSESQKSNNLNIGSWNSSIQPEYNAANNLFVDEDLGKVGLKLNFCLYANIKTRSLFCGTLKSTLFNESRAA